MKNSVRIGLTIGLLVALLAACAPKELAVSEGWTHPSPVGGNSVVFFTIKNTTEQADRLIGVASDVADKTELHQSTTTDGVSSMQMLDFVDIPVGETVFKPGDLHVMLIGLTKDLRVNETFDLTLTFEQAGEITITVKIEV